MDNKLIAVVDDDPDIVKTVSAYLEDEGFDVRGFSGAKGLFAFLDKEKPDLIILDLVLPGGMNGFEICRNLKEKEKFSSIPIIMLSGQGEENKKVSGLDMGADDYVVKPFSLNELSARIRAVLRRRGLEEEKITVGNIMEIDLQKYEVTVDGQKVELTPTEFNILEFLATRKGRVFTRGRILDYLWGEEKVVVARTVDVHVRHLREKLGKAGKFIKNVRGIGYKLEED